MKTEPDYTRYDCGACGHETLSKQYRNTCPVCSHRPMNETPLYAGEPKALYSRDDIREVFLRNGFTIKEGQTDLKDYVYAAAFDLLSSIAPQPPALKKLTLPHPFAWSASNVKYFSEQQVRDIINLTGFEVEE